MKLTGMHAYRCIILAARYGVGLGSLYFVGCGKWMLWYFMSFCYIDTSKINGISKIWRFFVKVFYISHVIPCRLVFMSIANCFSPKNSMYHLSIGVVQVAVLLEYTWVNFNNSTTFPFQQVVCSWSTKYGFSVSVWSNWVQ